VKAEGPSFLHRMLGESILYPKLSDKGKMLDKKTPKCLNSKGL
jgi:hypothetical protein